MVLKVGGEKHCVKHPHSGRPPSGNGGLSGVPAGDSFCSGGLAQMLLFVFSDADGNLCRSNQLLQVMLTMHRIIIPSAELLQKVISLYPSAQGLPGAQWDSSEVSCSLTFAFIWIGLE